LKSASLKYLSFGFKNTTIIEGMLNVNVKITAININFSYANKFVHFINILEKHQKLATFLINLKLIICLKDLLLLTNKVLSRQEI
jgi:hypothetical protein